MAPEIIVINLDCDTARLAHMRRQLSGAGLRYERFAALRGDALPADLARYFPAGARLSPGEIGCYASHLAIMQRIVRGEIAQPLLVLEDDVGLPADLEDALSTLVTALPARWDIVRLSYMTKQLVRPLAGIGGGRTLVRYSRVPTTTGAYLISETGARKFLAHRPRTAPIDHDLRRVWEWDLDTYGVNPPFIDHQALRHSSIDALSPNGRAARRQRRTNRLALAKQLGRGVRDFGLTRWLALGPLNCAAKLTPKPWRPAFVRWASARLA